jgi:hypothetical protein
VKEEYLDAAFDEMQKRYAMVEEYFSDRLASMPQAGKPRNLETPLPREEIAWCNYCAEASE